MTVFDELKKTRNAPITILHGTDWWTDCDDIAALRLLLRAQKAGIIELLGVAIDSVMPYSATSLCAFAEAEGITPSIGVDFNAVHNADKCRYQLPLSQHPHSIKSNEECMSGVKLYRKKLAESDSKVDITEVGFPTVLMQLLKSQPDDCSPLNGLELVKDKVNRLWMMAGKWDENPGKEYNFSAYPECCEAGAYVCKSCPVPITFLGFEVGESVITGRTLRDGDIMKEAFVAHGSPNGRCSWDPLTVLMAIINDEEKAGYHLVKGRAEVDESTGENRFYPDKNGLHAYVVKKYEDEWYADRIDAIVCE